MAKPYEKRIDWQRIYHKYRRSTVKKRSMLLDAFIKSRATRSPTKEGIFEKTGHDIAKEPSTDINFIFI